MDTRPTFQSQYDALLDAYYSVDAAGSRAQRTLELQSRLAQLSVAHGELRRALDHYEKILKWVDSHEDASAAEASAPDESQASAPAAPAESEIPQALRLALPELRVTALANLATCHHRLGDAREAMARLLAAKKAFRELREKPLPAGREAAIKRLEMALAANYAALLHTQRSDESVAAAEVALELATNDAKQADALVNTARLTATGVLASAFRARGDAVKAREQSALAARCLDGMDDAEPSLLARSHNYVGAAHAESGDLQSALSRFLKAYQINRASNVPDTQLQATLVYQIGRMLAELETTAVVPGDPDAMPLNAEQWLLRVDPQLHQGGLLGVLTVVCLGELALYAGDFAEAASKFKHALEKLKSIVELDQATSKEPTLVKHEVVKIQGAVERLLGNALLVQGRLQAAEEAFQRDLELALDSEDIHAQLRGLRNLAVLYGASRRFDEAITLWRETLEIAAVLDSKRDLLIGYGGLGNALMELSIADYGKNEFREMLAQRENHPRAVFHKQRALAIELADLESHARAQKSIVGTFEWRPQDSELEQRLEECDALVRLCERQDKLSHRADAYRSLANALTVQIKRLAERGQRFAEAIKVLTFKRRAILEKFRDAAMKAQEDARPARQTVDRVDVVSAASVGC